MNRSLAWLLMQLGEKPSRQQFGGRLMSLHEKAQGRWKEELQIAMNAIKLEMPRRWPSAMTRMQGVRPAASHSSLRHKESGQISLVRFSHDGKLLATAGHEGEIRLWNTADWSLAATIDQDGSVECSVFRPTTAPCMLPAVAQDWKSTHVSTPAVASSDKAYQGHHKGLCGMELSPDGLDDGFVGLLREGHVLLGHRERTYLADNSRVLEESRILPQPRWQRDCSRRFENHGQQTWRFEPFRGEKGRQVRCPEKRNVARCVPAHPTIVYSCYQEKATDFSRHDGPGHVVSGRWTDAGFQELDDRKVNSPGLRDIAVSADGKLLAAVGGDPAIAFFSLPTLKQLGQVLFVSATRRKS